MSRLLFCCSLLLYSAPPFYVSMPARRKTSPTTAKDPSTATIGFEAKLWLAANSRSAAEAAEGNRSNNMDAAEYKHVVLGLIFLKYISDTFEEHRAKLLAGQGDYAGADPEDPDEPSGARQTAAGSPKGERGGANQYKAASSFHPHSAAAPHQLDAVADGLTDGRTPGGDSFRRVAGLCARVPSVGKLDRPHRRRRPDPVP